MSLAESIAIALRSNVSIESSYLDRIAQKFDLRVAEDKFTPKLTIRSSAERYGAPAIDAEFPYGNGKSISDTGSVSADLAMLAPTGGLIGLSASRSMEKDSGGQFFRSDGWRVDLTQPLLNGGGIAVATASVKIARYNENINVQSLKSTLIDTVTSVAWAYRDYQQAWKLVEISRDALERAKEIVDMNKALIAEGRMAKVELVQTEADVASREIHLLSATNSAEAARLALVKLLRTDRRSKFVPEKLDVVQSLPEYEKCRDAALDNRPDFLSSSEAIKIGRLNVMAAKNNRLWDISLLGGIGRNYYSYGGGGDMDNGAANWNAGIRFTAAFGDLFPRQAYVRAKVELEKAELQNSKIKENIEIEVQDALREVEMKLKQVKLAQRSRDLYERKLSIEREKLAAGRSTNFQLVIAQNDLFYAQSFEIAAMVGYLNAHTALDRTMGVTLARWGLELKERYDEQRYGIGASSLGRVIGW